MAFKKCRTEHVDKTLMKKKGILVGYTPEVLTDDVADLTVALALMTLRGIKEHMELVSVDNDIGQCCDCFFLQINCQRHLEVSR